MTHIDTAEYYGEAENIVGEAIAGRRADVFLVSKVAPEHATRAGTVGGAMLARTAKAHSATPHQVALAFLTRRASIFAIPKAASSDHAKENAEAGDIHLTDAEIARVDAAFPRGARRATLPML